ncbi:hypothetical protein LMG7141_00822 [Ralstonia condita]|uniref:Uncharacterized protein n=1 Tax=Ralstonia condita TaxID=3058600 RepID=A0ABN9IG06_9RALS|nr:hypothetical protein [Ralstonia sp. LMG 7141]CAJ0778961.1 hypothetical protein LMG7141_00822 [Ralstonia sp. LMG 7141]
MTEFHAIANAAIWAFKARRLWLEARRKHRDMLFDFTRETGEWYTEVQDATDYPHIEAAHKERQEAAKEVRRTARKLRSLIRSHLREAS